MKITVIGTKKTVIEYSEPTLISAACVAAGEVLDFYCGGGGVCGKCKVYARGELSPLTETEKDHLTEEEICSGVRLACLTKAVGDATVEIIPKSRFGYKYKIAGSDATVPFGDLSGIAVDIGTTTVAADYFYHGKCLGSLKALNPQRIYGADVLSRIGNAASDGGAEMKKLINETIDNFADEIAKTNGIAEDIPRVVVGNTTMLHFYEGLDASGIGRAPFVPASYFGYKRDNTYLPGCISAYVGADAVSAVLASGMTEVGEKNTLLCDIGTNGEILFWDGEKLHACSTAAGPALEGAGIRHGMMACGGAIDKAWIEDGEVKIHVIDDTEPIGICGGGLIDLIACLCKIGIIDETGYTENDFVLGEICLAPEDVRAFQLAKSAIRSGIEMMIKDRDVSKVYVSGGFGSGISVDSAIGVGLFSESFRGKVEFIGNGALTGAIMMLSSDEMKKKAEEFAKNAEYTELSTDPEFFDLYIENMNFPEL